MTITVRGLSSMQSQRESRSDAGTLVFHEVNGRAAFRSLKMCRTAEEDAVCPADLDANTLIGGRLFASTMNFIDLLHLRSAFDFFFYWDDRLRPTSAILWLTPWLFWIVAGALFSLLMAATYNPLGKLGGVRMTMVPTTAPSHGRAVPLTPAQPIASPENPAVSGRPRRSDVNKR